MDKIYLDNGSTSFPKAPGVGAAMADYLTNMGVNVGRGGYAEAYAAAMEVLDCREALNRLVNGPGSEHVIFTSGVTASMNMMLKGLLRPGDHVLTSSVEHNAVMRPLRQLEKAGVSFTRLAAEPSGEMLLASLPASIRENTRAVVVTHASNVCGAVHPLEEIGAFCRRHSLFFIVDAAQTAGHLPIDMEKMAIDGLGFTGHKGLLGPQGIGGFVATQRLADALTPLIAGGTGSISDSEEMPDFLPDKFEPGTMNLPGIAGLLAALRHLEAEGVDKLHRREMDRAFQLLDGLEGLPGVRVVGPRRDRRQTPVVSVDLPGRDNGEIAGELDARYGVKTRCGLHCAPVAHKTLGTFPQGTIRFVPGPFTTEEEIDRAIRALTLLISEK